jgi:hypothetical protein
MWIGVPAWAPGFRVVRMDRWNAETPEYRAKFEKAVAAELKAGGIATWECWYPNDGMKEYARLKGL